MSIPNEVCTMAQSLFVQVVSREEKKTNTAFHRVQSQCPKELMTLGKDCKIYRVCALLLPCLPTESHSKHCFYSSLTVLGAGTHTAYLGPTQGIFRYSEIILSLFKHRRCHQTSHDADVDLGIYRSCEAIPVLG